MDQLLQAIYKIRNPHDEVAQDPAEALADSEGCGCCAGNTSKELVSAGWLWGPDRRLTSEADLTDSDRAMAAEPMAAPPPQMVSAVGYQVHREMWELNEALLEIQRNAPAASFRVLSLSRVERFRGGAGVDREWHVAYELTYPDVGAGAG